jgi:hypothetical protein
MPTGLRAHPPSGPPPLRRRRAPPDFVPQAQVPLFWDIEVPSNANSRRKSHPLLEVAQLDLHIFNASRLSPEFASLVGEGYSQDSFYGDEGEWTRDTRIEAKIGCF